LAAAAAASAAQPLTAEGNAAAERERRSALGRARWSLGATFNRDA